MKTPSSPTRKGNTSPPKPPKPPTVYRVYTPTEREGKETVWTRIGTARRVGRITEILLDAIPASSRLQIRHEPTPLPRSRTRVGQCAAFIPKNAEFVAGEGYRVALVVAGEKGYSPTGNWPYEGKPGQKMPWFWGPTRGDAEKACENYNRDVFGLEPKDAAILIAQAMFP